MYGLAIDFTSACVLINFQIYFNSPNETKEKTKSNEKMEDGNKFPSIFSFICELFLQKIEEKKKMRQNEDAQS